MSPATYNDSEGRLVVQKTTVVNIIVDMAETGESFIRHNFSNSLKTRRVTLTNPAFLLKGLFLQPRALVHFLHLNQVKAQVTLLLQNLPLAQVNHLPINPVQFQVKHHRELYSLFQQCLYILIIQTLY